MAIKSLHDSILLDHIMHGQEFISDARVEEYEEHRKDLALLKSTVRRFVPQEYNGLFRDMTDGSYSAYIGSSGSVSGKDRKVRRYVVDGKTGIKNFEPDELYKRIQKIFKGREDDKDVSVILSKISDRAFLKKQLTSGNGVIPNQVYVHEMKQILSNAEEYLTFLKEKDESGLSVSEKIIKLFRFKIPYYIGPVGKAGGDNNHGWAVRRTGDKIYPWNFYDVIDEEKTSVEFINRLLRKCTYLPGYTVLPRRSLTYEKFTVLNELNNLRINGKPIDVELKQDIYNDLFLRGKKVTQKALTSYLVNRGVIEKQDTDTISGIDGDFKASLSSVGKFKGIFKTPNFDREHRRKFERIIYIGTVYGDDKKRFKKMLESEFGSDDEIVPHIDRIAGFRFTEWGRFSREFLELEGASKEDGVVRSIIQTMWETNDNLMQILSSRYTFSETISERNGKKKKSLSEWMPEDIDDMYLSAPVKRMIWQTLRILAEIEEVMGSAPKRVFIEMTRSDVEKGDKGRKASRKAALSALYKSIKDESRDWLKEIDGYTEQEFRIKKLYLYYCQMGRSMYTGKPIDSDRLFNDNLYDIDHIYPQHFVKDDSLQNNCVLVEKQLNNHKQDIFPIEPAIQMECRALWKDLKDKRLITEEKYRRLTRTSEFSEAERAEFVSRQITETSQATKAVTQILSETLPEGSDIVFSKAGLVSSFRQQFDIYKCRSINDLHHAQDAYLNIVVGNAYFVKFTRDPARFIKDAMLNRNENRYKYHLGEFLEHSVSNGQETAWVNEKGGQNNTIKTVKKNVFKNSALITRRSYKVSGPITKKDTIISARKAKAGSYYPVKTSDERLKNVERYGGRRDIRTAYYCLVVYTVDGKEKRCLEAVPSYLALNDIADENRLRDYLYDLAVKENKKGIEDFTVRKNAVLFNSLLKIDGYYYFLAGKTNNRIILHNAVPILGGNEESYYLKKVDKAIDTGIYEETDKNGDAVLTKKRNIRFFDWLAEKLQKGVFVNRKGALIETMISGRDRFYELEISDQCKVLQQMILGFAANTNPVDASLLGGSSKAGVAAINKNLSGLSECKLISCSVTGLFERVEDLLTI